VPAWAEHALTREPAIGQLARKRAIAEDSAARHARRNRGGGALSGWAASGTGGSPDRAQA
jgi:hypothetical protein